MSKYAFAAAAALSALIASSAAMAAGTTLGPDQFEVKLTVQEACVLTSPGAGVNFDLALSTGALTGGTNTVSVVCTSGATANITLTGLGSGTTFKMFKDRDTTLAAIPYTVRVNNTEVARGGSVHPVASSGGVQTVDLVLTAPSLTTRPAAGTYTDWVTVAVDLYSAPVAPPVTP